MRTPILFLSTSVRDRVDWSAWRDEFPTFRQTTYLNTCSLAPLARRVRTAQERFFDEWEAMGASAWYETWIDALDALRRKVARVLGAKKQEIALAPSVSVALSGVASAINYRDRSRVVLSNLEFPTLAYQWRVKPGVEEVFVPSLDGVTVSPDAFEEEVDGRTALVATSHVYYTSGGIQDISRIAKIAHSHGAVALVDAYQATGQLPTDVRRADVDVLVTGGLKWLLGGTGIAFLYVRESLIRTFEPTIAGWFGNARLFDFDPKTFAFHETAQRFELGTPAVAAVYAASAALDIVLEIGVDRLRARTTELVSDLVERLVTTGFTVKTPPTPKDRAGIVAIESSDPPKVVRHLAGQRFVVDYRHDRVRVSPYFHNTEEDNRRFVEALQAASRTLT